MVQVVVLSANGESRTLKTTAIVAGQPVTGALVAKALRKTKPANQVGIYKAGGGVSLTVWGWMEGKAGTENKHELPPPHDGELLFGDAIVVSATGDFTAEGWAEFYDKAFGGFEDLGSDSDSGSEDGEYEEEEEEEEEEDEAEDEDGSAGEDNAEDAEEAEEAEEDAEEDAEEEEEEEEGADDDCCDEGEDGGGAKRRAPRRRAVAAPEYRRLDMGLRARIKLPVPLGKRAPKWHTAAELEPEEYSM
jgi:hypothetical protein